MGVEYFWDLPTRSLSENDKLTSSFAKKRTVSMPYLNKLCCDYRKKLGFDSIECRKATALLVITTTFKKKKGKSGKSKLGIKVSSGRKNASQCKLWFLVPFQK